MEITGDVFKVNNAKNDANIGKQCLDMIIPSFGSCLIR